MPKQNRSRQPRGRNNNRSKKGSSTAKPQIADYIPSPYNFVPLSSKVFFPNSKPSIDVPFSDGISGILRIKVTAKTPLYIRNGGAHPTDQNGRLECKVYQDFFRLIPEDSNSPYAIPGTSVKGMLRNVVEIASFGKISEQVDNETWRKQSSLRRNKNERSKRSIHQTIAHTSKDHANNEKPDLAESIFGYANGETALRGRVSIESLIADGEPQTMKTVETALSGPKPSFYPNYVKQPGAECGKLPVEANGKYKTYMDEDAEIRGWKRYIIRPDSEEPKWDSPPTEKLATRFCPLPAGTSFTGTAHVHNLRPYELGALVWAITWGGDENLRHSLGMGKPYGFGSVALEIENTDLKWCNPRISSPVDLVECQKAYVERMQAEDAVPGWKESPQLVALRACANPETEWRQDLRYPRLRPRNEFEKYKTLKSALVAPPGVCFEESKSANPSAGLTPSAPDISEQSGF